MTRLLVVFLAALAIGAIEAAPQRAGSAEAATARYFSSLRDEPSLLLAFLSEPRAPSASEESAA